MMTDLLMMIGTRKGLWIGRSDERRGTWLLDGPHFLMNAVYSCAIHTRGGSPRLLAGAMSSHFGPQVFWSDDLGKSWSEKPNGGIRFPEDTGSALEQIWQLTPGPVGQPDVVYAGTQPSALFRSDDRGESFSMVRSLWDHPHRTEWDAGFGGQAIHTIIPHPDEHEKITVAMSTGGVYQTGDGGESWNPSNKGIKAYFMPDLGRSSASACTRSPDTRPFRIGCSRRTTMASTAARTAAHRGSRSPTACRATSGSRSL